MTSDLERTLESLLFLSADPVPAPALADATGAELYEVVTALERLREHYEFERRGFVVRELAGGWALSSHPEPMIDPSETNINPQKPTSRLR